jgi:sn-glycerol 3-phosphate transport system substrate-binding protein
MHSLQDQDIMVSLDEIGLDADGKKWMDGFYPAFLANSRADGKLWSVPFQRSTAVQYYNKAHFKEVGLDPDHYPTTWKQLGEAAQKLTKRDASGRVTRWGIKLASDFGDAQWTFGALAFQAGLVLMNVAGTETYFKDPKATEAMAFWRSLAADYKATPEGLTDWGALTPDFLVGNTSIIQHTTGNLTNIRTKATFPFERTAALRFARFLSTPERAADWSIQTGYIATRPDAYETPALKDYVAKFPDANVARSYLPVATGELSTFENQRVYKALTDNIQACLNGTKTPEQAMADTQTEAERILKPYKT